MAIYHFFWEEFCDWFIELSKSTLYGTGGKDGRARHSTQHTLVRCVDQSLRLLHPFMPFITEEIWQKLPKAKEEPGSIMIARYPVPDDFHDALNYEHEAGQMNSLIDLIKAVRNIRGETELSPGLKIPLVIQADDMTLAGLVQKEGHLIKELARVEHFSVVDSFTRTVPVAAGVCPGARIFVPLHDLIDVDQEHKRLSLQLEKARTALQKTADKLRNENFLSRAPRNIVEKERNRKAALLSRVEKLSRNLEMLD